MAEELIKIIDYRTNPEGDIRHYRQAFVDILISRGKNIKIADTVPVEILEDLVDPTEVPSDEVKEVVKKVVKKRVTRRRKPKTD